MNNSQSPASSETTASSETVEVFTGTRLHFGLICGANDAAWSYGGIGLMVRSPGWRILLSLDNRSGSRSRVTVEPGHDTALTRRITDIAGKFRSGFAPDYGGVTVRLRESIPFHSGFGAGTQLALAVGTGLHVLVKRAYPAHLAEFSRVMGRAARSAIGTEGFLRGGFLMDHGRTEFGGSATHEPRVQRVDRLAIPDDWRFVLVRPRTGTGMSGEQERAFFEQRKVMPNDVVTTLAEIITGRLAPSIQSANFQEFSRSLAAYGQWIGRFYAAEQGDVIAHPLMRQVSELIRRHGEPGAVQSSWGPGVCIPAYSDAHATRIVRWIAAELPDAEFDLTITSALNTGATVRSIADDSRRAMA